MNKKTDPGTNRIGICPFQGVLHEHEPNYSILIFQDQLFRITVEVCEDPYDEALRLRKAAGHSFLHHRDTALSTVAAEKLYLFII